MNRFRWIIVILMVLLSGCGKKDITICNIDLVNDSQNYSLKATYKIHSKSTFVTKVEKTETYKSNDKDVLEYFEELTKSYNEKLNSLYGGYSYEIKATESRVIVTSIVDVKSINVNEMVKDGFLDKYYVTSNKLSLGGIKLFYKSKGAICKSE